MIMKNKDGYISSEITHDDPIVSKYGVSDAFDIGVFPLSIRLYARVYEGNDVNILELGRASGHLVDYFYAEGANASIPMYMDGMSQSYFESSYQLQALIDASEEMGYIDPYIEDEEYEKAEQKILTKYGVTKEDVEHSYDRVFFLDEIETEKQYRNKGYANRLMKDIELKLGGMFHIDTIALLVGNKKIENLAVKNNYKKISSKTKNYYKDSNSTVMYKPIKVHHHWNM